MKQTDRKSSRLAFELPVWLSSLLPFLALGLLVLVFARVNPLALFTKGLPPIESLTVEHVRVVPGGFIASVVNGGPNPVSVAQVMVDDAYWQFQASPSQTIPRLGRATFNIPYPWVQNEPHEIALVTQTGLTFRAEVALATESPRPGAREFFAYGLLGIYVGIIPVGLGMLWFPALRKLGRRWLGAILALTVGLLVFLLIDTLLEAIELGNELPGVFQGVPLVLFAGLLTWLALLAVGARQAKRGEPSPARKGVYLAGLIALGIGLHNLGEGLAIGAAFAVGEAALGSFLVIGFMLHNVTEGIGIVAPLLPERKPGTANAPEQPEDLQAGPAFGLFFGLAMLAGLPAILGAWLGGFAFSPVLEAVFFGVGTGAIWQVIVEVTALLRRHAERAGESLFSWYNVAGFLAGIGIMYFTAFLVKF